MKPTPPTNSVQIRIADADYFVSCSEDQREGLQEAAQYLDDRIRAIRQSDRTMTVESSAIIVALNLVDELYTIRDQYSMQENTSARVHGLSEKIDELLRKCV